MRPFLSVALLMLGLAFFGGESRGQDPLPPPPPAKDYFPKMWKDFTSIAGGFKVRYPGEPTETSKSIGTGQDAFVLHSFSYGDDRFIYYSVSYRDLPWLRANENETEARKFLTSVRDNRMTGVEDRMKLLTEKEATCDGRPALRLEIQLFENRRIRELDVIRGARHYNVIVFTFSNHGPNVMGAADAYGEIANSFLDSFHLIEISLPKPRVH